MYLGLFGEHLVMAFGKIGRSLCIESALVESLLQID